jgi:uncharacterized protein
MGQPVLYQVSRQDGGDESTPLFTRIALANRPWSRLKGLLGRTGLGEQEGIWFLPCNSIHSFGMKFVFDAVFMDKAGTVLALHSDVPAGKLLPIVWKAHQVLEVQAGAIARHGIAVGQQLVIEPAE